MPPQGAFNCPKRAPVGIMSFAIPKGPRNAQACSSAPSDTPENFPVTFPYVPRLSLNSRCATSVSPLESLSGPWGVWPLPWYSETACELLVVPRSLQTCHSGLLQTSQCVPTASWCSRKNIPTRSQECTSTWHQHHIVPAGFLRDSINSLHRSPMPARDGA